MGVRTPAPTTSLQNLDRKQLIGRSRDYLFDGLLRRFARCRSPRATVAKTTTQQVSDDVTPTAWYSVAPFDAQRDAVVTRSDGRWSTWTGNSQKTTSIGRGNSRFGGFRGFRPARETSVFPHVHRVTIEKTFVKNGDVWRSSRTEDLGAANLKLNRVHWWYARTIGTNTHSYANRMWTVVLYSRVRIAWIHHCAAIPHWFVFVSYRASPALFRI